MTTISVESPSKRQKLSTDPVDTTPDADGVTWKTHWSDLYIRVPRDCVNVDNQPIALVRFPVHRAYVCIFPLLERLLTQKGGGANMSLDMSKAGLGVVGDSVTRSIGTTNDSTWTARHWQRVLKFVYDYTLGNPPIQQMLLDEWMCNVGEDPTLATTHLMMYLCDVDLGEYLSKKLEHYNPTCSGLALAFCFIHSVSDKDSLMVFNKSPELLGSERGRQDTFGGLSRWLRNAGTPLKEGGSIIEAPTPQQKQVCEWLLLLVVTTATEDHDLWRFWANDVNIWADLLDDVKADDILKSSWLSDFLDLFVAFAPCAVHSAYGCCRKAAVVDSVHKLCIAFQAHIIAPKERPRASQYWFDTLVLFGGLEMFWKWERDNDGAPTTTGTRYACPVHPIFEIWRLAHRMEHKLCEEPPSHLLVCNSFKLVPRVLAVVEEQAVQEEAAV